MKKLLFVLMMAPAIARAEFWTGNDLYMKIQSAEMIDRIHAIGYVVGVYDSYVHVYFCPRENGITAGQVTDIVKQYLINNPSIRHMQAYGLVTSAFKNVWPCANKQPNARGV